MAFNKEEFEGLTAVADDICKEIVVLEKRT
jgi:hypothetical protein